MNPDQERLLSTIEDPNAARILAEIWKQIEGEPLAAARMIRAFQGAKNIITETLTDLPALWKKLEEELTTADIHRARFTQDLRDFRSGTTSELGAAVKDLKELQEFFMKLDDDKFLNRANRVLDLCDKLSKAKRDGTLDWLQTMLKQ